MIQTFEVRDHRNKAMFRVDDEYLNGYAKLCGINATGVYMCICRHADTQTQTAFPSVSLMAERLGISERSVQYAISALKKWNIVSTDQKRQQGGKFLHNTYTLLDKKYWTKKPDANIADGNRTQNNEPRDANNDASGTHQVRTKVAHSKETHNKGSAPQAETAVFVLEEKLENMENKAGSHLDIIATFIRISKLQPKSSAELTAIIQRHAKIASTLTAFTESDGSMPRIFSACKVCQDESLKLGYQWSLETVYKKLTQ